MKSLFYNRYISLKSATLLMGLLFIFNACKNNEDPLTIYPLESNSDAFSIKIGNSIPLSNEAKAVIAKIDKLVIYKDRIFILDQHGAKGLLIFTDKGEFLAKTSLGNGPGELVLPQNFNIINDQLLISDRNFIKYYTLNGEYLKSVTLPELTVAWSFEALGDNKIFTHGITIPLDNETVTTKVYHVVNQGFSDCSQSFLESSIDFFSIRENNPISHFNGRFLLTARPYNDIYEYNGQDFKKKYYVDFDMFNFSEEDISKGVMNIISLLESGKRCGLLDNIKENIDYIYFVYGGSDGSKSIEIPLIYSKSKHVSGNINEIFNNSDLPRFSVHQLLPNRFILSLNPGLYNESELEEFKSQGIITSDVTPESNPIILFAEISLSN